MKRNAAETYHGSVFIVVLAPSCTVTIEGCEAIFHCNLRGVMVFCKVSTRWIQKDVMLKEAATVGFGRARVIFPHTTCGNSDRKGLGMQDLGY